jgi:hypothetical protein
MKAILVVLALIADIALVANVYHHWTDQITVQVSCAGTSKIMNCGVVK